MGQGKIVLLNGVSSSGKTSLAEELAVRMPGYFRLSVDDFDGLIEQMEDRESGSRLISAATEVLFHRTVRVFSDQGVNVVVDHVLHDEATLRDCLEALQDYPVFFVGVHCPAEELARRELARGDRWIGLAHTQLKFVHQQHEVYDVEVDTARDSVEECARVIFEKLQGVSEPSGWRDTIEKNKK